MDDPSSLRAMLDRNQETVAFTTVLSLLFAVTYAVMNKLDWRGACLAVGAGSLFAATLWLFMAEYWHISIVMVLPIAAGCGIGAFPLLKAYVKRSDAIADGVVDGASGWLTRWLRKKNGEKDERAD